MTRAELADMTVASLRKLAGEQGVVGASRMAKTDLVEALGDAMGLATEAPVDPKVAELESMTVMQLRRTALDQGVVGAARMNKAALIELLAQVTGEAAADTAASIPPEVTVSTPREVSYGFPETYGIDRVVLLVRDPEWLYCYWDISGESWAKLIQRGITNPANGWKRVLRLYDMTGTTAAGAGSYTDLELDDMAREWYFQSPAQDRVFLVEFGYRSASGEFLVIARSNLVQVPRKAPSDDLDVRFGRLYDDAFRLSLGGSASVTSGAFSFPGSRGVEEVGERLSRLLEVNISSAHFSGQAEALKRL